jgi:hypothetical protein
MSENIGFATNRVCMNSLFYLDAAVRHIELKKALQRCTLLHRVSVVRE